MPLLDNVSAHMAATPGLRQDTVSSERPHAKSPRGEHLVVNNVRFWSMLAVIAMHSCAILVNTGQASAASIRGMMTPFKFGTIAFFLASGFLLGERLDDCAPVSYLRRRLEKIALPWTLWLSLLVLLLLGAKVLEHRLALSFNLATAAVIASKFYDCIFSTAFWFVPNLMLSLAILLLFRPFLRSPHFGALLLVLDLCEVAVVLLLLSATAGALCGRLAAAAHGVVVGLVAEHELA